MHSVVLHSHFFQPPREDPWLEEIAREPEAEPYENWTSRVAHQSYRGVVAARVLDGQGCIRRIVNTLAYTSFDVAPPLLAWLERRMPIVYEAILAADRESLARTGFGNAIAHPYDHVVLPLASRRDKSTTVRWGIADFARRFGRAPDGMWLPETAIDDETLDVLVEQGIRFTIVAPHQVATAPASGAPGTYTTANGRDIALVIYDGGLSHAVAFGGLLRDGHRLAEQLAAPRSAESRDAALVALALAGETYGHHHRLGEMGLAAALDVLERHPDVRLTNPAAFLDAHPPRQRVEIVAPSAWSCEHGVDRWRGDCGCCAEPGMHHRWKAPLREAIDTLVSDGHALFEREGIALFGDPWAARDQYEDGAGTFVPVSADDPPVSAGERRARALLEMERHALRAQTSVAWFFDDVVRPEALIVLRAAARLLELAGEVDGDAARGMEARFVDRLSRAETNDATIRSARDLYLRRVRPTRPTAVRVAAGFAAARRFGVPADGAGDSTSGVPPGTPDGALPPAWSATVDRHTVRLVERRTGRAYHFDVLVDVPGPAATPSAERAAPHSPQQLESAALGVEHPERGAAVRLADVDPQAITVIVRQLRDPADGGAHAPEAAPLGTALKLHDLPHRAQQAIERAMRRAVVHRLLDPDERARLAAGETDLVTLVSAALRRAVRALADDASSASVARVLGLIDLRDSLRGVAPFDAQTLFHELRAAASPEVAARLMPVARRLGFSPRAWENTWHETSRHADRSEGAAVLT